MARVRGWHPGEADASDRHFRESKYASRTGKRLHVTWSAAGLSNVPEMRRRSRPNRVAALTATSQQARRPRFGTTASPRDSGLTSLGISQLERKAKPSAVAFKRVIVDDDANVWPLLSNLLNLRRVGLARNRPVAVFVVPDVMFPDAARHQIESAFVPNSLPAIE